jgi:RNA polymerase sigma factor (sigma-70 family)
MSLAPSVTPAAPTCTEHELVAAVRRGDDRAFAELYSRYRARIGSYVFGMVGDHQRAEDLAQEVFISALRRLRDTERPLAFKPWIYEIAKNACIDEFRRARRTREVPLQDDEDDGGWPPLVSHGLEAEIENKQRLENLRGAFDGLSESHHRLIVMRELEGLSYDQIGERMGMSRPVVESTLFRARRRLSKEYDELVSGRRCEQVQTVIAAEGERPLRKLGIRDRRQLARHLAHCQPCRRYARIAGVDESFFHTPSRAAKIAALLPFPWLRWRRSRGGDEATAMSSSHAVAALQSLPVVARLSDPSSPVFGMRGAGAAAAALLIAGAGGGLVAGLESHPPPARHGTTLQSARASHSVASSPGRTISVSPGRAGSASTSGPARRLSRGGGGAGGSGAGSSTGSTASGSSAGQSGAASRSPLAGTVGKLGSTLQGGTSGTGGTSNTPGQVASGASNSVNQVTQGASNAANHVTQGASNTGNQVTQGASNTLNHVTQGASNAVNQATQGASNPVSHVTSGAAKTANKVTSGVSNTLNTLTHP